MANEWLGPGERGEEEYTYGVLHPEEMSYKEFVKAILTPSTDVPELVLPDVIRVYDEWYDADQYSKDPANSPALTQEQLMSRIDAYWGEMHPEPEPSEPKLTPIGETTIGEYVYLQYEDQYGEIYTDPDPVREADDTTGDRFVGVEGIGGYDFPVYEKSDGTRYVGDDAFGRTPETAEEEGRMTEWQEWQSEYLPEEAEAERELERWQYEQELAQSQEELDLQRWSLEQQYALALQELEADIAYQEWEMGYIPHEAQQEYELNKWQLEQEFALQQDELELRQAELAQEQSNYLADLAAHPISWLEYSRASGTTPLVQPWMLPLSSGDYSELGGLQAGQPVPGWPEDLVGQFTSTYSPVSDVELSQIATAPEYTPFEYEPYSPSEPTVPVDDISELPLTPQPVFPEPTPEIPTTITAETPYSEWPSIYDYELTPEQYQQMMGLQPNTLAEEYRVLPEEEQPMVQGGSAYRRWLANLANFANRQLDMETPAYIAGSQQTPEQTMEYVNWAAANPSVQDLYQEYYSLTPEERAGWQPMAGGGVVQGPTLALLGEREPEVVIPLSKLWNSRPIVPMAEGGVVYPSWSSRGWNTDLYDTIREKYSKYYPGGGIPTTTTTTDTDGTTGTNAIGVNDPYYPYGNLPQMDMPSLQYWARMGPTAQEQLMGYMQATTGITPEEYSFRLQSMAPPSGRYPGIYYLR
jgi:hypothetical protein